jgi:RHS repeat-associated protein
LYGPDLNGQYGGENGTGGLEGVSPYLNTFNPVISDARGNVLAEVTNGVPSWILARPTGYGAVPGYRPVAFGNGVDLAQSSAWRGRAVDVTGYYHLGLRDYDPVSGQWLSYDPMWNDRDPNGQSFCGGDPVNGFDSNGRCVETAANYGVGLGQGFLQGYTGISTGNPYDTANYNGQMSGRDLAGLAALWMTLDGTANMGTGAGIMAVSAGGDAVTLGAATPVAGPAFAGGAVLATGGAVQTGVGAHGLYNFMNLPPLQSPSNDSGGGGTSGSDSTGGQQNQPTDGNSQQSGTPAPVTTPTEGESSAGTTLFHYTDNPNLAGQGLNVNSGVTSVGDFDATEAMFNLGIDPPTYVYPVTLENPGDYLMIDTGIPARSSVPAWQVIKPTPSGSVGTPMPVPTAPK